MEDRRMSDPVRIIGSYISPYVRKVLVTLHVKRISYDIDPIIPFMGDDRFSELSPLRRIPVLLDDQVTLSDSSVICQYLEDRYPLPPLYPHDVAQRARARWLEEFADTRMGEVFIWRLFNQVAIKPFIWGEQTDPQVIERTLREDVPPVLDYLEGQVPADGFLFGDAAFARFRIDPTRWPRTAGFVERVLGIDSFVKLRRFEELSLRTPLARHRA